MSDPKNAEKNPPKAADEAATELVMKPVKKDGELIDAALDGVVGGFNPQPDPPKIPE